MNDFPIARSNLLQNRAKKTVNWNANEFMEGGKTQNVQFKTYLSRNYGEKIEVLQKKTSEGNSKVFL